MISFFALDVCVAMDTAAHDTSSSDLDESGLEHVFVLREGEYVQNYAWK